MNKARGWIYVLHFDQPISHAQHYIGCTSQLKERLITHAQGRGANLVRVANERGITWRLAALGSCNMTQMRRVERSLKDWHGAGGHCQFCCHAVNIEPRQIPGTTAYPIASVPYATDSANLRCMRPEPQLVIRQVSENEPHSLSLAIAELMQANKHYLGWVPAGGVGGITTALTRRQVIVAEDQSRLVGYCYHTRTDDLVRIHQVCVLDCQRTCGIGRVMVELTMALNQGTPVTCAVRDDLPANRFWQKLGFALMNAEVHETSGSRLNRYYHENESQFDSTPTDSTPTQEGSS